MKKGFLPLLLGLVFASSSAQALVIGTTGGVGGNPVPSPLYQVTVEGAADIGQSFTMDWYLEYPVGEQIEIVGATATYTVTNFTNGQLDLSIDLSNTSSIASILSFGFNTDPNVTGVALNGSTIFQDYSLNSTFPGFQTIDICIYAQNCTGGAFNNGLLAGGQDNLSISLMGQFDSSVNFYLSDFPMKFQGLNSYELAGQVCTTGCTKVPEPASVALLAMGLLGLGSMGGRRRKL